MWEMVGQAIMRRYDASVHTLTGGPGFIPVIRSLPRAVGTNGQISSWGAQLAGAAPPHRIPQPPID